jgi:hypothetical protein
MSSPLVQALPALIGVGVGAVATGGTTYLVERSRWRRQQATRWDDARMRAYVEYGDVVKRVSYLASRIAAGRGFQHSVDQLEPGPEAMEALEEADGARARAWESVLLLGDPQTIAAARAWHVAVWRLVGFARGQLTAADQWEPSIRETDLARDRFYYCARQDLGVKGEAVATPAWPPESIKELAPTNRATDD